LIPAPPVMQVKAAQVGQVFRYHAGARHVSVAPGGAASRSHIYLGATSAFGIQIVRTGPDWDSRTGFAPATLPRSGWSPVRHPRSAAGRGSIYRIDGQDRRSSLFATSDNSGPGARADVVFDPATRQFFARRISTGPDPPARRHGTLIDSFDHGWARRGPRAGLAAVPDDGKPPPVSRVVA